MAAPESQVLRDEKRICVPSPPFVSGDNVFMEAGYYFPSVAVELVKWFSYKHGKKTRRA
jgi:hypothetical protein